MPYGFVGQASQTYLTTVGAAMSSAHAVHSKSPYGGSSGGACAPPPIPSRSNYNAVYSPDTAMQGGYTTGVGNQTNVVVNQNVYDEVLQKIQTTNAKIAEDIYNLSTQIDEMCETIFIVPNTLPGYLDLVNQVKSSLGEFQSLAEEARISTYGFVNEIMSIDGR